jgi:hypothetical protein
MYFNFKGYFSKVIHALVDADYHFICVDVGANGISSEQYVNTIGALSWQNDKI